MYTIQTLNKIAAAGTKRFDTAAYTVTDTAENPDAIMVRSAAMHDMTFGSNLLAIARAGAGTNNIPVDRCAEEGICVFNTPGANANAVKELVLTGLLLSSRKIPQAIAWAHSLEHEEGIAKLVEKGKSQFAGPEIKGKTLGIIGLGAIGALVANAAIALGMQVVGTDPFLSVGAALRLNPAVKIVKDSDGVFAAADYLTIHVPFNNDTKGMINAETIAKMKDGVLLINTSRGPLIVEEDLAAALHSGKVAGAGLDVLAVEPARMDNPLMKEENCLVTPHIAWAPKESRQRLMDIAVENLKAFLAGAPQNVVNA